MVRQRLLCLVVLGALLVSVVPNAASAAESRACSIAQVRDGSCSSVSGEVRGPGVDLIGEQRLPGGTGPGAAQPGSPRAGQGAGRGGAAAPAPQSCVPIRPGCVGYRDGYTVTGVPLPTVTLRDLVNFRPAPGIDLMEPNGWMVVGLDTNFYAQVGQQVQSGLLLGLPADVRFTPKRYHWTYGDGGRADLSTKGSTWAAQGIPEFDPTPTSHVYRAAGTYYIDLTIDFGAEYRWANGSWRSLAGTIPVPANRLVATAGGAKTVLVERDCTTGSGRGC